MVLAATRLAHLVLRTPSTSSGGEEGVAGACQLVPRHKMVPAATFGTPLRLRGGGAKPWPLYSSQRGPSRGVQAEPSRLEKLRGQTTGRTLQPVKMTFASETMHAMVSFLFESHAFSIHFEK